MTMNRELTPEQIAEIQERVRLTRIEAANTRIDAICTDVTLSVPRPKLDALRRLIERGEVRL